MQLTTELGFGAARLGGAAATFRLAAMATVVPLGRAVDRIGATRSLRLAALAAAVSSLGVGLLARSWMQLVIWLAIGGVGSALGQPAANRLVVNAVPRDRQGLGFGIKQASQPTATMLSGLSVPLVAVTFGWRAAFVIAAALALFAAVVTRGRARTLPSNGTPSSEGAEGRRLTLSLLGFAFAMSTATSSALTTFAVESGARSGTPEELAGTILAAASVVAIVVRVLSGWACDRLQADHLLISTVLMTSGTVGLALLASGRSWATMLGVVLGLSGVWGQSAVFWFAVLRAFPSRPGAVTGSLAPGADIGAAGGPLLFGIIAQGAGFSAAWSVMAVMAASGAAVMFFANRLVRSRMAP